jgi:hypothetical protein
MHILYQIQIPSSPIFISFQSDWVTFLLKSYYASFLSNSNPAGYTICQIQTPFLRIFRILFGPALVTVVFRMAPILADAVWSNLTNVSHQYLLNGLDIM